MAHRLMAVDRINGFKSGYSASHKLCWPRRRSAECPSSRQLTPSPHPQQDTWPCPGPSVLPGGEVNPPRASEHNRRFESLRAHVQTSPGNHCHHDTHPNPRHWRRQDVKCELLQVAVAHVIQTLNEVMAECVLMQIAGRLAMLRLLLET